MRWSGARRSTSYRAPEPEACVRPQPGNANRILWIAAHPGAPASKNPFTCAAPPGDCTELADPAERYLCDKHAKRLWVTGRLDRDPCRRCGAELDTMSPYLCLACYHGAGLRWCSHEAHEGSRILPTDQMGNATRCRAGASHAARAARRVVATGLIASIMASRSNCARLVRDVMIITTRQ